MFTRCQIEFYDSGKPDYNNPVARIYQHCDGYPDGIIPQLRELENILANKSTPTSYGDRRNDPEWAAAEFISKFRSPMGGNIYVTQQIHGDIAYLYRVVCEERGWTIRVYRPVRENDETVFNHVETYTHDGRVLLANPNRKKNAVQQPQTPNFSKDIANEIFDKIITKIEEMRNA